MDRGLGPRSSSPTPEDETLRDAPPQRYCPTPKNAKPSRTTTRLGRSSGTGARRTRRVPARSTTCSQHTGTDDGAGVLPEPDPLHRRTPQTMERPPRRTGLTAPGAGTKRRVRSRRTVAREALRDRLLPEPYRRSPNWSKTPAAGETCASSRTSTSRRSTRASTISCATRRRTGSA
jgi:hypothetical protein